MTTKRCRPGDLAVIIASEMPENLGRFVDVLHESAPHKGDPAWWVRMRNGPGMRADGPAYEGRIRDKRLQPIRGPKDEPFSQVDEETAVPAVRT
jgi:hypothetical protein